MTPEDPKVRAAAAKAQCARGRPARCGAVARLHDHEAAACEGVEGHPGPHHARITLTWTASDRQPETREAARPA